jgi:hypothetical protein
MKTVSANSGMRRCAANRLLVGLSRLPKVGRLCLAAGLKLEGGQFYSVTARQILKIRYGVDIGAYSYGSCFVPGDFPPRVTIGRYVSVAQGVCVLLRNHPLNRLSMHPFFYNHKLGYVDRDTVEFGSLSIGHDAWLGERAIFTPGCRCVGLIKYRFSDAARERVAASRWWEKAPTDLARHMNAMLLPVEENLSAHPLLGATG